MPAHFERLLNLAKKSQSKLVVYDRFGGDHFVILPIDDFEQFFDSETGAPLKNPPSGPTAPLIHPKEEDLRRVEVPVPSFFAPVEESTPVEQPANDDEPLYYEEISQGQEDESVVSPASFDPLEPGEKTEVEVQSEPTPELELEPESKSGAKTEAEIPQQSEPAAENSQVLPINDSITPPSVSLPSSRDWHRLGDVIRRVHPEILPSDQPAPSPVPYQEHPDDSEDAAPSAEPVFLEEPVE